MTADREALHASWDRTRHHLGAALALLADLPGVDLSEASEFLAHNELGLAFESLADLGDGLDLPPAFRQHLDRAAREMWPSTHRPGDRPADRAEDMR